MTNTLATPVDERTPIVGQLPKANSEAAKPSKEPKKTNKAAKKVKVVQKEADSESEITENSIQTSIAPVVAANKKKGKEKSTPVDAVEPTAKKARVNPSVSAINTAPEPQATVICVECPNLKAQVTDLEKTVETQKIELIALRKKIVTLESEANLDIRKKIVLNKVFPDGCLDILINEPEGHTYLPLRMLLAYRKIKKGGKPKQLSCRFCKLVVGEADADADIIQANVDGEVTLTNVVQKGGKKKAAVKVTPGVKGEKGLTGANRGSGKRAGYWCVQCFFSIDFPVLRGLCDTCQLSAHPAVVAEERIIAAAFEYEDAPREVGEL